jgi:hypothetical protein
VRDQLTSGADGFSGEESNRAGFEDSQSKPRQSSGTANSQMTICKFVETKFLPEYIAYSWQTIHRKHKVLAAELDKEFGFSSLTMPKRMATEKVEDGKRTANQVQLYSI